MSESFASRVSLQQGICVEYTMVGCMWSVQVAIELCANCLVGELFGVECVQVDLDDG